MKTLVFSVGLVMFASFGHAQIVQLSEAKVEFTPEVIKRGDQFIVDVKEDFPGEFEKDPVAFLTNKFDIVSFIELVKQDEFESYQVNFRSRKGELKAEFDEEGNLLKTSQKFRNVQLPVQLSHQLYRDYKGWELVKSVHIASGEKAELDKDFYLITMKNGKDKKKLRTDYSPTSDYVVAQL